MNKTLPSKIIFIFAFLSFVSSPIWRFWVSPELTKLPSDFSYKVNIYSTDNFYDDAHKAFSGEVHSKTVFYYDLVSEQQGVYLIRNVFDVKTPEGKPIFAVERLYGIDPKTIAHVKGYGDKDREGYLFAPRNLHKQEFTYWHINYDTPANMKFKGIENLYGLQVYHYESDYTVDQTANLGNLPGVPKVRGVNDDIHLDVWLEPVTGRLINYKDQTVAYYYNIKTNARLNPWNKFSNTFKEESIKEEVRLANREKLRFFIYEEVTPLGLLVSGFVLFLIWYKKRKV